MLMYQNLKWYTTIEHSDLCPNLNNYLIWTGHSDFSQNHTHIDCFIYVFICVWIWTFWSEVYGHVLILQTISMTAWDMMHLAFGACSTLKSCKKSETSGFYRVRWSSKCVPGNLRVPGYCPRDFSSLNSLNGNTGFNWYILITFWGS